jgi:hypothetical protein
LRPNFAIRFPARSFAMERVPRLESELSILFVGALARSLHSHLRCAMPARQSRFAALIVAATLLITFQAIAQVANQPASESVKLDNKQFVAESSAAPKRPRSTYGTNGSTSLVPIYISYRIICDHRMGITGADAAVSDPVCGQQAHGIL